MGGVVVFQFVQYIGSLITLCTVALYSYGCVGAPCWALQENGEEGKKGPRQSTEELAYRRAKAAKGALRLQAAGKLPAAAAKELKRQQMQKKGKQRTGSRGQGDEGPVPWG